MTQEQCAKRMQISRPTVTRIYDEARRKMADMLVGGKSLTIGGGDVFVCPRCGRNVPGKSTAAIRTRNFRGESGVPERTRRASKSVRELSGGKLKMSSEKRREVEKMKVLIIGGVAAGTKTAAKLKREDRRIEVTVITKDQDISYAGCGLPYYVGGFIESRDELIVNTPQKYSGLTGVEVRTGKEAVALMRIRRKLR